MQNTDVFMQQETHGTQEDANILSNQVATHRLRCSRCENPSAGGVITGLCKDKFDVDNITPFDVTEIIPGRVLAVVAKRTRGGLAAIIFITIHVDPGFSRSGRAAVFCHARDYAALHLGAFVVLGGDSNDVPDGKHSYQVQTKRLTPGNVGSLQASWDGRRSSRRTTHGQDGPWKGIIMS